MQEKQKQIIFFKACKCDWFSNLLQIIKSTAIELQNNIIETIERCIMKNNRISFFLCYKIN